MTELDQIDAGAGHAPPSAGFREAWSSRAKWQRVAAIISLVLTMGSGVLIAAGGAGDSGTSANDQVARTAPAGEPGVEPSLAVDGLTQGLWDGSASSPDDPVGPDPSVPADGTLAASSGDERVDWSPAVFKTGFSFFMGFALAFAVRSFVRISLVAIGLMGLMLFGLEYMGLITVEWGEMAARWDGAVAWLRPQLTSFQGFITGQLPSAAAATGGLVTGWRRG